MTGHLRLPFEFVDPPSFGNFVCGDNQQSVDILRQFLQQESKSTTCYLWGAAGAGKSHLLYAACKEIQSSIYFSLLDLNLNSSCFNHIDRFDLVCLDDIQSIAGQKEWERELFFLFEKMESNRNLLLIAANEPPHQIQLSLDDLVSRLLGRQIIKLQEPTDAYKIQILVSWATHRSLVVAPPVVQYILNRYSRDMHSLVRLFKRLDKLSFAAGRQITIPFLRKLEEFQVK